MTDENQKKLNKFIRLMGDQVARGLMSDAQARECIVREKHLLSEPIGIARYIPTPEEEQRMGE